jgi:hypothetical protein
MISQGEEHPLPEQALKAGIELDFRDGKRVSKVQTTVHIWIGKGSHPFRILGLKLLRRQGSFFERRVGLKVPGFLPFLLVLLL